MRTAAIVLTVVFAICLAPLASVAAASAIAEHAGCRLDEGSVHPCIIWGPTGATRSTPPSSRAGSCF